VIFPVSRRVILACLLWRKNPLYPSFPSTVSRTSFTALSLSYLTSSSNNHSTDLTASRPQVERSCVPNSNFSGELDAPAMEEGVREWVI